MTGRSANFRRLAHATPRKQVLVFVHGFNNHFEDAVFRFAQFVHDTDHESASYSRDALEEGLRVLAKHPEVRAPLSVVRSSPAKPIQAYRSFRPRRKA